MTQRNLEIRKRAKHDEIKLWQIGELMGMSDANFSRLLRNELDQSTKKRILSIIHQLKEAELRQEAYN